MKDVRGQSGEPLTSLLVVIYLRLKLFRDEWAPSRSLLCVAICHCAAIGDPPGVRVWAAAFPILICVPRCASRPRCG
eukprot:1288828-Pyramimonas_sp.AAC.1